MTDFAGRRDSLTHRWRVSVERWIDTPTSEIGFGKRDGHPVVLKVVKTHGDEWNAGAVTAAFEGRGMVRVLEHESGGVLLERATPGDSLVEMVREGRDDDATDILAGVMAAMHAREIPHGCPTAEHWGRAFASYRATGDTGMSSRLVDAAGRMYFDLCATQQTTRLLHGDLQHYNVIVDRSRGWLAIDPKGVVAEREFEVGPFLRNPDEMPELYSDRDVVARRLTRLCSALQLDYGRAVRWAFALAVLSAIWEVEDNGVVRPNSPALVLARAIEPLIGGTATD